jgi:hypothetical protein
MNDARQGVVRLDLPDGRSLPLSVTYQRLDMLGHGWVIEKLEVLQKGKAGANQALADLIGLFTNGAVTSEEVMESEATVYPLGPCTRSIWAAWELAFHGPAGRPATEGPANPQMRRPTLLKRLFGAR